MEKAKRRDEELRESLRETTETARGRTGSLIGRGLAIDEENTGLADLSAEESIRAKFKKQRDDAFAELQQAQVAQQRAVRAQIASPAEFLGEFRLG